MTCALASIAKLWPPSVPHVLMTNDPNPMHISSSSSSSCAGQKRRVYSPLCYSGPCVLVVILSILILNSASIHVIPLCDAATVSQNPTSWNEEDEKTLLNGSKYTPKDKLKSTAQQEPNYPHISLDEKGKKRRGQPQQEVLNDDVKKLWKQKRIDRRLVRRVLNAAKRDLHYDVLGLRTRWNYPLFDVLLWKRITPKDIKRAFYKMAKLLHPDKNVDDRAEEAFIQLERSAKILLDEELRSEYDTKVAMERKERREVQVQITKKYFNLFIRRITHVVSVLIHVIKPIYAPVLILGALII